MGESKNHKSKMSDWYSCWHGGDVHKPWRICLAGRARSWLRLQVLTAASINMIETDRRFRGTAIIIVGQFLRHYKTQHPRTWGGASNILDITVMWCGAGSTVKLIFFSMLTNPFHSPTCGIISIRHPFASTPLNATHSGMYSNTEMGYKNYRNSPIVFF
jgi:hypothetical protein